MSRGGSLGVGIIESIARDLGAACDELPRAARCQCARPLPSSRAVAEILAGLRAALYPRHFGHNDRAAAERVADAGYALEGLHAALAEQIHRAFCFACGEEEKDGCAERAERARTTAETFLARLPNVRRLLNTDVRAAYDGDPAARNTDEIILCYPGLLAITYFRLAHELHALEVPILPRMMTERAHSKTGIDIHPGATIGEGCFIDHGTGVVVGETCIIGQRVRIYQGVTLGAKSFQLDEKGLPVKGIPRHPIVEDEVIIYSEATILGRITIGRGSIIGGNVWLTHSVPPGSRVSQARALQELFDSGSGI